jgi:transposase
VRPQGGSAWAPQKHPVRHRATYTRHQGVRHYFGGYDVYADRLWMRATKRKCWRDVLRFLKSVRRRYPDGRRICLVLDNFSAHKRREVVAWCEAHGIEHVYTATNASWMNRIECHFTGVKRFVISNSDYPDHAAIAKAMRDYVRWRNRNRDDKELRKNQNSTRTL